jgi:hypothetical protein
VAQAWVGGDLPLQIEVYAAEGELVASYDGVWSADLEVQAGDLIVFLAQGDGEVELVGR